MGQLLFRLILFAFVVGKTFIVTCKVMSFLSGPLIRLRHWGMISSACAYKGVSEEGCTPWEAEKNCIFFSIVQFGEYF